MSASAKGAALSAKRDPKKLLESVHDDLVRVDALFHRVLPSDSPHVSQLVDHAAKFRGKQLRPALVVLAGRACGRADDSHIAIGAIVEMIHTATLLHDDVLDHATTRRNVASINALHGNEIPILLGDFIYAQAYSLANTLADRTAALELAATTKRLCTGEIDQNCSRGRWDLTLAEYLRIIEDKTASLYATSCKLGAYYAGAAGRDPGAHAAAVIAMEEYGRLLGIAFQIIDDCLDLAGDEKSVGKSLGTDLTDRKMTLPLIRLLGRVEPPLAAKIRQMLQDGAIGDPRAALRQLVDFTPDVASAAETANQYVRDALMQIAPLPPSAAKQSLIEIAEFVLERDR